jgi:hypothetical protein
LAREAHGWETWQPIESNPRDGAPFLGYAEALVDLDFNPSGVIEACFDGERFIGAVWDGCHDVWQTRIVELESWKPFPAHPEKGAAL